MRRKYWFASSVCVIALAAACSKQSAAPTSPTAAVPGNGNATGDGSTLKVSAPTPVSPINGVKISQGDNIVLTVNNSSATQSVTKDEHQPSAVVITDIALWGTAPKQFAFTDDCGKSLAGHATCTLEAIFRPATKGAKTAYLDVNGGGGGLRSVKLTGTGT